MVEQLQRLFFDSTSGWWVEKKAYVIGAFVKSVNDLVAGNGHDPRQSRRINANWVGQPTGEVKL